MVSRNKRFAIQIFNKIYFNSKDIKRDGKGQLISIKGNIQQEEFSIMNIHARTASLLECKTHMEPQTIILWGFNTPLSLMDTALKWKLYRDTVNLIEVVNEMDLIDIYRTFHPKTKEYTLFSVLLVPSPKLTICWDTKQAATETRHLK